MKTRKIALVLSAVMAISLLAGCGGESSPSNLSAPPNTDRPASNSDLPISTPPASDSDIPPATGPSGGSGLPSATPSQFPENREEVTLTNGETAWEHEGNFADDMGFTIFITNDYTASMEGEIAYIRNKSKPDEAYIEVKYIKGGKMDTIAPSVLDNYDKIIDLIDHDTGEISIIPYRLMEGHGEKADWKAYVLQGVKGVIQVVIREGAGEASALEAMMETFEPK